MALLDIHRPHGSAQDVAGQISKFAAKALTTVVDWNDARRTRKELSKLTEHELDDLGLSRADIASIGRGFHL